MQPTCQKDTSRKPREAKSRRRSASGRGLLLSERDRRIVSFVHRFRLLSRDQLMALAPFGSLTRANTRLPALVRARLLSRKSLPVYPGKGSAQALYFLGSASRTVLEVDAPAIARHIRQVSRWEMPYVEHVIKANQVVVDFLTATKRTPDVALFAFRTEPELRQVFVNRPLVPDGWLAWVQHGKRFNCFVEVDLHHEGLVQWRKKVLDCLAYAESGLHEEVFGFRSFRVLVLAKSRGRLENIRRVAQQAGRLFLFAEIEEVTSQNLLGPAWLAAWDNRQISLSEA